MRICTVLGTRPEIIRLSRIIPKLDAVCEHILVHTGQNYDANMSDVFFSEFGLRNPDYRLSIGGGMVGVQLGKLFADIEQILTVCHPDRMLILGDTNSALCALIAVRMGIPVYHMEAGNRSYDPRMPEEVNRRVIDHVSTIHMPYTERSRANLLRDGIASDRIFVTGNPIYEILQNYHTRSDVLEQLRLDKYLLVTAHRQENVDDHSRLASLIAACSQLVVDLQMPIVFSRHPRTAKMMQKWGISSDLITFHEPFGFADFLTLEKNAACVLTDSGTVQEECCIMNVRCVTLRDNTERPETVECGSNILSGVKTPDILRCVKVAMALSPDCWLPPAEYVKPNVSDTVLKVVTGY